MSQGGLPNTITGIHKRTITDVTCDDDYTTGGKAVTAAQLGLSTVISGDAAVITSSTAGDELDHVALLPQTDGSAKLICHLATGAECGSSEDHSGVVVRVTALGY